MFPPCMPTSDAMSRDDLHGIGRHRRCFESFL
jgi:hypothetical protein